uniref:Glutamyl-tRNA(Gln) amidotransferase subunit C, chloroplastic/mitochondrial n=1 Tax=Opuntia streptacantha TaxID=393608 RepID=A0A7C9CVG1_OPUST
MAIGTLITLRAGATLWTRSSSRTLNFASSFVHRRDKRNISIKSSSFDPPDVGRLAETARISLTPQEVEEFGPKIQQVVEWFGQLQAVDLDSVEPAIRSDIDGDNFREDVPRTFGNREAIIAGIPSYEEPYIKVPKVLNKE